MTWNRSGYVLALFEESFGDLFGVDMNNLLKKKTVDLSVLLYTMTPMWRHCNEGQSAHNHISFQQEMWFAILIIDEMYSIHFTRNQSGDHVFYFQPDLSTETIILTMKNYSWSR